MSLTKNRRPDGRTLLPYNLFDDLQDVWVVEKSLSKDADRKWQNALHAHLTVAKEEERQRRLLITDPKWIKMQQSQSYFHTKGIIREMEAEAAVVEAEVTLATSIQDRKWLAAVAAALESIRAEIATLQTVPS